MTENEFHGYSPEEYPDTELKRFGLEKYEAVQLLASGNASPDRLMWLLELAWMRGHNAATVLNAPTWNNPYVHPDKAIARFDKDRNRG